jgi:hypothetical protein
MNKDDKAWLLAVVYASTQPKEITPEEFLFEVDRSEVDFLSCLQSVRKRKVRKRSRLGSN